VYVGRKSAGAPAGATGEWGNPFAMSGESDRQRVIQQYSEWLRSKPELCARARRELRGKVLACWCAPKDCHAHVLAEVANGGPGTEGPAEQQRHKHRRRLGKRLTEIEALKHLQASGEVQLQPNQLVKLAMEEQLQLELRNLGLGDLEGADTYRGIPSATKDPERPVEELQPAQSTPANCSASAATLKAAGKTRNQPSGFIVSELPTSLAERLTALFGSSEAATVVGKSHFDRSAREARRNIAQDTVLWCSRGWYPAPTGEAVQIAAMMGDAMEATTFFPPSGDAGPAPKAYRPPSAAAVTAVHIVQGGVVAVAEAAAAAAAAETAPPLGGEPAPADVGVLNFASARHPGGGFLKGANAQEESLARCTGLYACLTRQAVSGYYRANSRPAVRGVYTDGAILSPCVPLLRHEDGEPLACPRRVRCGGRCVLFGGRFD
jgi:hypothetical protein